MASSAVERRGIVVAATALALSWLALQGGLLWWMGLRFGGDSGRYLDAAASLLDGALPAGKAISYLGYDAFVALFLALGMGPPAIVAAQMALSAVAGWCLYRTVTMLYGERAGMIAAAMFLLYPPLQMWNLYVLTESVFVSSVVIAVYALIRARGPAGAAAAAAAVVFATLVRPHGVAVPMAAFVFALACAVTCDRKQVAWLLVGAAAVLAPAVYVVVGRMLAFENPLEHYLSGTVIWGADEPRLEPPAYAPAGDVPANPIAQIALFAVDEPFYFARLAGAKLFWFLARARPYYSDLHNALIAVTMLPLYALALRGLFTRPSRRAARWLLASVWVMPACIAALTFADWDSRHSLVTLPAVFAFAAAGVVAVFDAARSHRRPQK